MKKNREEYIAQRNTYIGRYFEQQAALDKLTITLATSAFGFSLAYINHLSTAGKVLYLVSAKTSWLYFAISLLCSAFSYYSSTQACRTFTDVLDHHYEKEGDINVVIKSKWQRLTFYLNTTAYLSFLLGILFLIFFFWLNTK